MRISYNWLKEFVDFTQTPEELSQLLTFLGLETRVIEQQGCWTQVITARVQEVGAHPNADKLHVCRLNDGAREYSVVCGAPNVAAGQIVPLAVIGAELPGGLHIKRAKIRGVESEGMICSEKELGLAAESAGILVLPSGTPVGKPLEEVLGESDAILELEITTNRPDCLSHWGVAREIGAKLRAKVQLPEMPKIEERKEGVAVTINDPELCPRYLSALLTGVKIGPSPDWMARRLEKCGLRPINNIVDITNYVLLELGHPLHAFDLDKMAGGKIIVRRAQQGENIVALDGKKYALSGATLVIADEEKPQAIAGIMGGEGSGVTERTKSVVLESAMFSAQSIRRSSKALNLASDASYRFERGTGWDVAEKAYWRAIELISKIAGGKLAGRGDAVAVPFTPVEISLRPARVQHVLNVAYPCEEIKGTLTALGIEVREDGGMLTGKIPSWRLDLSQEIDLIEEIARIHGYDQIPVTVLAIEPDTAEGKEQRSAEGILRERLKGLGFMEAVNYSLAEEANLREFGLESAYRIANPLSKENEVLRPALVAGLWKNFKLNIGQGCEEIRLVETGTVFTSKGEHHALGMLIYGQVWSEWWGWEQRKTTSPKYDFYFLNGIVNHMLAGNHVDVVEAKNPSAWYHPGKTARLRVNGEIIGEFGILRPEFSGEYDAEIGYAEFNLTSLEKVWNRKVARYESLRRFPPVKRDIALMVPKSVPFDRIVSVLNKFRSGDSILEEFRLFSRYEDAAKLGDQVSYALHLFFRHSEHTLTDTEVSGQLNAILERLQKDLNVSLRA